MRTMPETAAITAHITSPSCAIWPLISCPRNPPRVPCVSKSNGPVGRTLTSQSSSPKSEMRLPCARESKTREGTAATAVPLPSTRILAAEATQPAPSSSLIYGSSPAENRSLGEDRYIFRLSVDTSVMARSSDIQSGDIQPGDIQKMLRDAFAVALAGRRAGRPGIAHDPAQLHRCPDRRTYG